LVVESATKSAENCGQDRGYQMDPILEVENDSARQFEVVL